MAGAIIGVGGTVIFGVYHWFFVAPVVAVFVEGILWGGGAGALVGLSYHHGIVRQGRTGWAWDAAFAAVFVTALVPYEIVGLTFGPFAEITRPSQILPMLPVTLLGVPVLALGGWLLTRALRGTLLFVVAGFVLHFFIGGSAAHFGGRGQTMALVLVMAAYETAGAFALGAILRSQARLDVQRPDRRIEGGGKEDPSEVRQQDPSRPTEAPRAHDE